MKVFVSWIGLFLVALLAQSMLLSQNLFWGLLLLEIAGAAWFVLFYPLWKPQSQPETNPSIEWDVYWITFALAVFFAGLAALWMWLGVRQPGNPPAYQTIVYAWLAFLVFLTVSCGKPFYRSIRQSSWPEFLPPAGLALLSLCLGLYRLTDVPYTVHGDEGMVGIYARRILEGDITSFFSTAWYSLPQFFFWVPTIGMMLFGDSLFGLRMSSVIVGMASVLCFYWVCRSLWGTAAAVFAGILLMTNHWFIQLTHSGVSYIQAVFFAVTAFAMLHFMNKWRSPSCAVLGGLVLGLGLMSYQANHLLPILWAVSQIWLFVTRGIDWKWLILSIIVPLLIAVCVIAPLWINLNANETEREMFTKRAEGVGIWMNANWNHMNGAYRAEGNPSIIIRQQLKRALFAPLIYADTSIQYNGQRPILDYVSASLWAAGAACALFLLWHPQWSLPLIWTISILIAGGALTVDPPFFPRLSGSTAFYFLLIAGLFGWWFRLLEAKPYWQYGSYLAAAVIVAAAAGLNLSHYFATFANEISVENIHARQTRLAYFMRQHCPEHKILLIPGPHISTNSGTCNFLANECQAMDIESLPEAFQSKNVIVVIDPSQAGIRQEVLQRFEGVEERMHYLPNGELAFYSYRIP